MTIRLDRLGQNFAHTYYADVSGSGRRLKKKPMRHQGENFDPKLSRDNCWGLTVLEGKTRGILGFWVSKCHQKPLNSIVSSFDKV